MYKTQRNPAVDGAIAGFRRPAQVDPIVTAAGLELTGEDINEIEATGLDAPVSGSVTAAEDGTLAIMASGPEDAFRTAESLLHRLGRTVTYVGRSGQALLLKLAINSSLATQMLAFSEGVLLAERGGARMAGAPGAAARPARSGMLTVGTAGSAP